MAAQNPNYDPDSNGDDLIGAEDLVSLLGVYNTSLAVDTTLECDFDGTAEDEWLFDVITGKVIIDSIVVQFSITDSATYYEPGCPIEQVYHLNVEMEYTMLFYSQSDVSVSFGSAYSNPWESLSDAYFGIGFDASQGSARLFWNDFNLQNLRNATAPYNANFHFPHSTGTLFACINVPDFENTFSLTDDGILGGFRCDGLDVQSGPWNSEFYNYFRLLPYWHYAE